MENVVVHIISHSHWDREWYLPFESHRMQLVELFDNLFDLFENDPEFKSFHLDGQTIVLDDYLEIRPENPYFYQGEYASGLGSSHTFYRYIWPIALSIQGLTTTDKAEKKFLLDQLVACDGGTGVMHESFHVDDPTLYSREWFSWANMMFCELVLDYLDIR